MGRLSHGLIAGAVGTLALNAATYLDMAVRGRAASRTPERSVRAVTRHLHVDLGGDQRADNRAEALGALLGYAVGAGAGAGYAVLARDRLNSLPVATMVLTGLALLAGNGPMTALRITDPRHWSTEEWLTDLVPHLGYGLAAAYTYRLLQGR